ncbi:imidazolonepropionase [Pontibacter beigongshangensis]|uniref:imidazolonepropionase n=1 Tax=Pontibacter beigongshangensis TaxID=2574733 RepID=UPI00293BE99F|nr:imidazolonepropionase [Pontibacter beigongshangensis]
MTEPLHTAGILLQGKKIYKIGPYNDLKETASALGAVFTILEQPFVCLPGFIDAHTHICFAGSRASDYALRNEGKSYLEIAASGGGIWDTVTQTRSTSLEDLAALTTSRAERHLREGVTTIEVKSGYGLSVAEELKMLRAIKRTASEARADILSTCLAAHTLPKDFRGNRQEYLRDLQENLFPVLLQEQLCSRVDAFIEKEAFSADEIRPYFRQAKQQGFDLTVHADQFSTGGSALAVELEAVSADHLEASTDKEIKLLAASNTVAVALPGASVGLGCAFAPARKLLDQGASLAIASDWNPGSAPMGDLLTLASVLGVFEKLSAAEVFAGITFRAARALGLHDRGKLAPGFLADFVLFPVYDYREILYHQGKLKPAAVWKRGRPVL